MVPVLARAQIAGAAHAEELAAARREAELERLARQVTTFRAYIGTHGPNTSSKEGNLSSWALKGVGCQGLGLRVFNELA